jgi:hypothetical protein
MLSFRDFVLEREVGHTWLNALLKPAASVGLFL